MSITIKELISTQTQISRLDLELILAHLLNCTRTKFYSHPETILPKSKQKKLEDLIKKRQKGIPVEYLTNQKEFYGTKFYVDERVLIPRPETELIIDEVLLLEPDAKTIHDIGTGSGAIGLTLAQNLPNAKVTLTDISEDALMVAAKNKNDLKIPNVEIKKSDLLENIQEDLEVIVTNLPYISKDDPYNPYEPDSALFAGKDGLDLYRKLFAQLSQRSFSLFIGEFGFNQSTKILEELKSHFTNHDIEIKEDLAGIPRIFIVQ